MKVSEVVALGLNIRRCQLLPCRKVYRTFGVIDKKIANCYYFAVMHD